jgi:hypothetical protein
VSHPIRTDSDRTRVLKNASATIDHLLKIPHTINDLRRAIDEQIEDGIRAASYDGRVRGGSKSSQPESIVVGEHAKGCTDDATCRCPNNRSDRACEALYELDEAIRQVRKWSEKLHSLSLEFPIYDVAARKGLKDREPGKGKAPANLCAVCWMHGTERERFGGTGTWCPSCAQFKRTYGERPTVRAVWEILHIRGHVPLNDLRRLWPEVARKVSA